MVPAWAVEGKRAAVGAVDVQAGAVDEAPDRNDGDCGGSGRDAEVGCMRGGDRRENLIIVAGGDQPGEPLVRLMGHMPYERAGSGGERHIGGGKVSCDA